jgi:hypothetical protein
MTTWKLAVLTIAAFVTLAPAPTADAQVGGLIRKKVTESVKGPDKAAEAKKAAPQQSELGNNPDVLEITEPVLEGFVRGLHTEISLRKEFRAELAKYPTPQEYQKCQTNAATSEEGQKIAAQLMNLPDNATPEQSQKAMQKMTADLGALTKKKCPLDPADWPQGRRQARLDSIRVQAAASAVIEGSSPRDADGWENEGGPSDVSSPLSEPVAAGMTVRQYEILLERIQRFCTMVKSAANDNKGGSGGVKIPGTGKNIFWVFTAAEAKTLSEANCQRVNDLIGQMI